MNILSNESSALAEIFRLLGQPIRIQILLIFGREEACVCHIEALLNIRQATISQHLMVLRDAGLVSTNRDGRNIFYRLATPELFDIIYQVAAATGIATGELALLAIKPAPGCPCPRCNPEMDPELTCKKIRLVAQK
ncbi:MAG TPA: metalloregulator ArsR/SmtB family transcription factor [Anaerolineaceae bacterium]